MADSTKMAMYATDKNSVSAFTGHYTAYKRDGKTWYMMTNDKAYINGECIAYWQAQQWQVIPAAFRKYSDHRDFIIRQLALSSGFISDRKPFIHFQDGGILTAFKALSKLKNLYQELGNLESRILYAEKYLKINRHLRPIHVYRFDKSGNISGISLAREHLLDMYLLDACETHNIESYFMPTKGTLSKLKMKR